MLKEFTPKSIVCFREGYTWNTFLHDLFAGLSVAAIALPLSLAFAIASGVPPEKGLYTAIAAGFLISLLGGSRVQIGGPAGAFVVVVYTIIQKHGYEGLAVATVLAGLMLLLMGIGRLGILLRFIPYPVTTGLTTGLAVVIFVSQVKDFFGLRVEDVPPDFLQKCKLFCATAHTWNVWAFLIAFFSMLLIFALKRFYPKLPGAITAVLLATLAVQLFDLPVSTIDSKFGGIPQTLPIPMLPKFSYDLVKQVFPDAVALALLGALESLLSAVVADGLTGNRHRSNCELVAQGLANIGSILFGGIPATGVIARTSANIRLGAKTPVAGMLHAVVLLLMVLFLAPAAGKIPLAALSGVLFFVAWNMSELPHFLEVLKGQKGDALVLLITFLLTVLIDLAVAVEVGVVLSAVVFLKRMSSKTTIEACQILMRENEREGEQLKSDDFYVTQKHLEIPKDTVIFEIRGPFFYAVADLLDDALLRLGGQPGVFILRVNKTSLIDATGTQALIKFAFKCRQKGILFLISDLDAPKEQLFQLSGITRAVGPAHLFKHVEAALAFANRKRHAQS
jgi:sulfate permease, SulP family